MIDVAHCHIVICSENDTVTVLTRISDLCVLQQLALNDINP